MVTITLDNPIFTEIEKFMRDHETTDDMELILLEIDLANSITVGVEFGNLTMQGRRTRYKYLLGFSITGEYMRTIADNPDDYEGQKVPYADMESGGDIPYLINEIKRFCIFVQIYAINDKT